MNKQVCMKLPSFCIGYDNVLVIVVSETSLFMLNLIHFLSHCELSYMVADCIKRLSF
jgi:hypothetical protein